MAKKETAEQKLLKMIEASAGSGGGGVKVEKKVQKKIDVVAFLKISNRVLVGVIFITAIFLFNEVRSGMMLLNKGVHFSGVSQVANQSTSDENFFPKVESLSFYLFGAKRRNLFQPFEPTIKNVVDVSKKNQRIAQKTANLRLVGVSWLDSVDTASVMIEDVDKKTTYFLQKGEKIEGGITIKTIYADSVKLGYENEEIIIRYDKSQL